MRILSLMIAGSVLALSPVARAEDSSALADRLSRIERDMNFLQRQVYRTSNPADGGSPDGVVGSAAAEVRLGQMSEEIRGLRGQIEQMQLQARQNAETLRKLSADMDYRLQALEQKQAQMMQAPAGMIAPVPQVGGFSPDAGAFEPDEDESKIAPKIAPTGKDFPDANAHYNHAFKLLNDKNYTAAATSFDAFVKKYPGDPLAGNAYYWLGESYYARGDYTRASEGFRKGFEANPDGEKAADNLLKLAMSLAQVKRITEACVVLNQIGAKYAQSNARTATKAAAERTALQCK